MAMNMQNNTRCAALAALALLGGCSPGDDAAQMPPAAVTDKFADAHFLRYFAKQPSLAAGDYTLVVAPAAVGTGTWSITYARDGTDDVATGSWTVQASSDPADADNPAPALALMRAGGLTAALTASTPACLYLLDRARNIVARAGDADTATAACNTGATIASIDLPASATDDESYARAYYATIDQDGLRETLDEYKAVNGFTASDTHVIFRDTKDLGYGRDMYFHDNNNGTFAFYVQNFVVDDQPGLDYGPLNLEAAIRQVYDYHIGTNAIEYGPVDADDDGNFDDVNADGTVDAADYFPRFYNFSSAAPFERKLTVDLDGKGEKAMPGPCIVCHGGRADPLLPSPVNANAESRFPRSGDTLAHLQPLDVGSFEYGAATPWTRAEVEPGLKVINTAAYESYAAFEMPAPGQWDSSMALEMLESWYGGFGLPGTFSDTYVPSGWQPDPNDGTPPANADQLYREVVSTYCRTCHLLRGTHQRDIDFTSWDRFISYDDRIEELVFDAGLMPLATLTFVEFHENPAQPELLASFLPDFSHFDSSGALLLPGRPIAKAGPDRSGPSPLSVSGSASLFASSYAWQIIDMPVGAVATLADAATVRPTLTASLDGAYVLSLVDSDGSTPSAADTVTVTVDSGKTPAPAALTFDTHIAPILGACTGCHQPGGNGTLVPPVFYSAPLGDNRDVYDTVRALVNFDDPVNSRILRKPSGNHHAGGTLAGFDLNGDHSDYDTVLDWILEGAREN
ncbi:MAG TPA: hypothetical protein VM240_11825 [Verrucomicrobiae bacterium]|nr:hypothetical protein [Verrucomicrobiae bacterium]